MSYLRNSTIRKPSFRKVVATLDRHHGFPTINYSRITVQNSTMGKPSYKLSPFEIKLLREFKLPICTLSVLFMCLTQ